MKAEEVLNLASKYGFNADEAHPLKDEASGRKYWRLKNNSESIVFCYLDPNIGDHKNFINILDRLKKNEISNPFEIDGGLILLKLEGTQSYKTARTPKLSVIFSISNDISKNDVSCSEEKQIKGPVLLSKVEKNIRAILIKLMPGESYKLSDNNGSTRLITLCEKFINEKKDSSVSYENAKKNEEAIRLSNALMLELRRNTTVVKK